MACRELAFYLNPCGPERPAIVRLLAEHGVTAIGLDGFHWDSERDREEFDRFLHVELAETGLRVHSMHALPALLAEPGHAAPDGLKETQLRDLRRLAAAGGRTAVYHTCWLRDVPPEQLTEAIQSVGWQSFRQRYARSVTELAAAADGYGITVVLENIWHTCYADSAGPIVEILERVDAPNVGMCLDSGHAHLAGKNVAQEVRTAGAWLRDTHFHDNFGRIGDEYADLHIPPGLGTIDWRDVCRALDDVRFGGPVVFEGVLGPGDSVDKGRFGGRLSHRDLIRITVANWRAFEALAEAGTV